MPRILAALLVLAPALPAREVPVAPPPRPVVYYFPTTIGDEWVYQDGDEVETNRVSAVEKKGTARVVSVSLIKPGGEAWLKEKVEVSGRGLFLVKYGGVRHREPECELRRPCRPGETWDLRIGPKSRLSRTTRGVETVTVPAGTFEAVAMVRVFTYPDGSSQRATVWYAAGVGRIRVDYSEDRPRSKVMNSFTPGKKQP